MKKHIFIVACKCKKYLFTVCNNIKKTHIYSVKIRVLTNNRVLIEINYIFKNMTY